MNKEMHVNNQYRSTDSVLILKFVNLLPSDKYIDFDNAWKSVYADKQLSNALIERLQSFELRGQERFHLGQNEALAVIKGGRQNVSYTQTAQKKFFTQNEIQKCNVTGHLFRHCPEP